MFLHSQDLATQLFYWDYYRQCCAKSGRPLGKFLSVRAAEFLSGFLSVVNFEGVKIKLQECSSQYTATLSAFRFAARMDEPEARKR